MRRERPRRLPRAPGFRASRRRCTPTPRRFPCPETRQRVRAESRYEDRRAVVAVRDLATFGTADVFGFGRRNRQVACLTGRADEARGARTPVLRTSFLVVAQECIADRLRR